MADLRLRVPAALLALLCAAPQAQAQWKFSPQISVSETYSDNPGLARREDAHGQWITAVNPGFDVSYVGPRLTLSGTHQWNYYYYSRDDNGTRNNGRQYQGAAKAIVIDELLFVDANASRTPRSQSAFGPQLNDNPYALVNSREVSTWSVSPYLRRRFGPTADLTARYTVDSVDAGVGTLGSSDSKGIDVRLDSGSIFRTLGWGLSYRRQDIAADNAGTSESENALANLSLRVSRTLALTASGGYDKYDYEDIGGGPTQGNNWSAGFDWTPSSRTRLELAGGRHFYGNTWNMSASHRSRRSVWSARYNDGIVNSRDQLLRPDTTDITALVDEMFRSQIRNPIRRADAVAAYILDNGLARGLGQNAAYFANRFLRQKSFNAAVVFNGPRAKLTLSADDSRRSVLSVGASPLLALPNLPTFPGGARPDDNVHQSTVGAIMNYQITARSAAQAGLTFGRSSSLVSDAVDYNQALRMSFTRQLTQTVSSLVEVRHVRGSSDVVGGRSYHENAITAALNMKFKAR